MFVYNFYIFINNKMVNSPQQATFNTLIMRCGKWVFCYILNFWLHKLYPSFYLPDNVAKFALAHCLLISAHMSAAVSLVYIFCRWETFSQVVCCARFIPIYAVFRRFPTFFSFPGINKLETVIKMCF